MRRLLPILFLLTACSEAPDVPRSDERRPRLIVAGQVENEDLVEASGLARSHRDPEMLWALNDGGSKPRLFAFDFTGAHRGRLTLDDAKNRDWEDIASFELDGQPWLLVADIGDNDSKRKKVSFYVVAEPDLAEDDLASRMVLAGEQLDAVLEQVLTLKSVARDDSREAN